VKTKFGKRKRISSKWEDERGTGNKSAMIYVHPRKWQRTLELERPLRREDPNISHLPSLNEKKLKRKIKT